MEWEPHTLDDLQGRLESWVALLLLIDLGVQLLADVLGDGIAIDLDRGHIDSGGREGSVGVDGGVVVVVEVPTERRRGRRGGEG